MNIRFAKESDKDSIINIWNYCFNDGPQYTDYYFNDRYKPYNTIVVEERDNIVSSLQINQYKLQLNNKEYDTSYVVGVSTLPEARGMGYMKHIMDFTLEQLYEKNQLVSILMPIDYRLYRKYGYEHCYDQIEYEIDINELQGFKSSGILQKATINNIDEMVNIQESFLQNLNGKVKRDEDYYLNLFKEVECESGNIYIHKSNESDGYIIYFIDGERIFVRDLYYKNINALKGMLRLLYNHNTQCKKVVVTSPLNDKIRFVLSNPKTCNIKIKPFMMGRVINFKKYLESLDINTDEKIDLVISLKDNQIKENNKIFKITNHNNRLEVECGNLDYDVEFDINTISQLAFSYINANEAYLLNNIEENNQVIEKLNLIFEKKENYINEYI